MGAELNDAGGSICDDSSVLSVHSSMLGNVSANSVEVLSGGITAWMDSMMVILGTDSQVALDVSEGTPLASVKEQESVLKKLGNISRYNFSRDSTKDQFDAGRAKLKNVTAGTKRS